MPELDDIALLKQFAENDSEPAFAGIVSRHLNLVYSTAFRATGDAHAAQEISQAVFIILARKAKSLGAKTILSGWLHQTARLTAANYVRGEIRRQKREQETFMQSTLNETNSEAWLQIAPILDDAISKLGAKDRDAIVLRFFENKSLGEVGAALGASEDAAKMRVNRALEKLRKFFAKRGVTFSAAAIAGAVSANSVQAAPVGLAKTISAVAITKGAAAGGSTLALVKGALKIMAWTKAKTAVVVSVGALLIVGAPTVTVMAVKKSHADAVENYFAHWDKMNLDTISLPDVVTLRPSKYANKGDLILVSSDLNPEGRLMRRGASFTEILQTAYGGFGPEQMVLPANLPRGQFDILLTVPKNSRELLRAEIKKQFGIVAHPETRDTDVLVLKNTNPNAPGLKISSGGGPNIWENLGSLKLVGYKISDPSGYDLAHFIGALFNKPVIDETGLTNSYDVDAKWNGNLRGVALQNEIERVMREQFGLEVVKDNRPVEMLIVEKSN